MSKKIETINAIIVFTDIRGFTKWSENIEVFRHSPDFVGTFYDSLKKPFYNWYFKRLGDGSLFIKELKENEHKKLILSILTHIKKINEHFDKLCKDFEEQRGQATSLSLGWGVARGSVNKIINDDGSEEYIGAVINKTSRLCDIARPYGLVIDAQDFSNLDKYQHMFSKQLRRIKSLGDAVEVWVTEEIATSFQKREDLRETPEVHVAGFCIKEETEGIKILIAKRSKERRLYPELFEGCGGQLKYSESFVEGVTRHFRCEMNITIKVLENIHQFYSIVQPKEPYIPGILFLCKHIEGIPKSQNHEEIKWVSEQELLDIDASLFIPGVKAEVLKLVEMYKSEEKYTKLR